jgi:hypothetical protein
MNNIIESFTPQDFLAVLPPTSIEYAMSLFDAGVDPIEIAIAFAKEPGEGLATKGGGLWPKDIVPRLQKEIHTLLCTEAPEYSATREKLKGEASTTANVIVYVISNAVAIHAGMAVALCVPLVAFILAAIAKASLQAWCKAMTQQN